MSDTQMSFPLPTKFPASDNPAYQPPINATVNPITSTQTTGSSSIKRRKAYRVRLYRLVTKGSHDDYK